VDRIAGDDVRHAIRLGGTTAPRGESSGGSRLRGGLGATKGFGDRVSRCFCGGDGACQQGDERARHGTPSHGVVTETRTLPTKPFCVTRRNIDRWPQTDASMVLTR